MAEPDDRSPTPKPAGEAQPKTETKPGPDSDAPAEGSGAKAKDAPPPAADGRKLGLLIGVVLGALILAWAAVKYIGDAGKIGETIAQATKSTGAAAIGGPFELTDHNGKRVTDRGFPGKYLLVYFGYTYCPDVCPTGLTDISNALDQIGPLADKIQPLFITIDPARDTPEQLKEYATYFHPKLLGLTGTPEDIAKVAKAYRIYYAKVTPKGANADPDDYTMDHSAIMYLMAPDGKFIQHFGHGTGAETLAKRLTATVRPGRATTSPRRHPAAARPCSRSACSAASPRAAGAWPRPRSVPITSIPPSTPPPAGGRAATSTAGPCVTRRWRRSARRSARTPTSSFARASWVFSTAPPWRPAPRAVAPAPTSHIC